MLGALELPVLLTRPEQERRDVRRYGARLTYSVHFFCGCGKHSAVEIFSLIPFLEKVDQSSSSCGGFHEWASHGPRIKAAVLFMLT